MTKFYNKELIEAEKFDGSQSMIDKYNLVKRGLPGKEVYMGDYVDSWGDLYDDDTLKIGDYLVYEGGVLQVYTEEDFFKVYTPIPTLPHDVGEVIKDKKARHLPLYDVMGDILLYSLSDNTLHLSKAMQWIADNEETFSWAWLLGEWSE